MRNAKKWKWILCICLCLCLMAGMLSGCYLNGSTFTIYLGEEGSSDSGSGGSDTGDDSDDADSGDDADGDDDDSGSTATYLTPTRDYTEWQEYTSEELVAEDISEKEIAYQFSAEDIELSEREYDVLVNLYADGYAQIRQYYLTGGYYVVYYGYWANMNDEYLYFGISCHTNSYSTYEGVIYGISYSYTLTIGDDGFETFGLNLALGFAEGGQFVRSYDMSGDGTVVYATVGEFETQIGWVSTDTDDTDDDTDDEEEEVTEVATLSGGYTTIVLYSDGTYVFAYQSYVSESGTWSYEDGVFSITTAGGSTYTAEEDEDGTLGFTYTADINSQLADDYTISDEVLALLAGEEEVTEVATLSGGYTTIVLYSDGTYVFAYQSYVSESGTWSYEDGVFSVTTAGGSTYTAEEDEDGTLGFTYTADINSQLADDYTISDEVLALLG